MLGVAAAAREEGSAETESQQHLASPPLSFHSSGFLGVNEKYGKREQTARYPRQIDSRKVRMNC